MTYDWYGVMKFWESKAENWAETVTKMLKKKKKEDYLKINWQPII